MNFNIHAQQNENIQTGTVTLTIQPMCEIIVDLPNSPIHFTCNRKWQHRTKHVQVISNCKWTLRVRPKNRYLYCYQYTIDGNLITYQIVNTKGEGEIHSPESEYQLFQRPYNPPFGKGNIEFDILFSLDTEKIWLKRWGNYNTKVDITCTPDTN